MTAIFIGAVILAMIGYSAVQTELHPQLIHDIIKLHHKTGCIVNKSMYYTSGFETALCTS